jgi:hypothetical protein
MVNWKKNIEQDYTEATKRSSMVGENEGALGFSPATCCCFPFLPTLACVNPSSCHYTLRTECLDYLKEYEWLKRSKLKERGGGDKSCRKMWKRSMLGAHIRGLSIVTSPHTWHEVVNGHRPWRTGSPWKHVSKITQFDFAQKCNVPGESGCIYLFILTYNWIPNKNLTKDEILMYLQIFIIFRTGEKFASFGWPAWGREIMLKCIMSNH